MIRLNGEDRQAEGKSLKLLLTEEGFELDRVVVERNLEIVPLDDLEKVILKEGDTVEVLRFVGGG